jgi:hypothetical protein
VDLAYANETSPNVAPVDAAANPYNAEMLEKRLNALEEIFFHKQ